MTYQASKAIGFLEQVAHLTKDGEKLNDGELFIMTDEDAQETLASLIDKARYLIGEGKHPNDL